MSQRRPPRRANHRYVHLMSSSTSEDDSINAHDITPHFSKFVPVNEVQFSLEGTESRYDNDDPSLSLLSQTDDDAGDCNAMDTWDISMFDNEGASPGNSRKKTKLREFETLDRKKRIQLARQSAQRRQMNRNSRSQPRPTSKVCVVDSNEAPVSATKRRVKDSDEKNFARKKKVRSKKTSMLRMEIKGTVEPSRKLRLKEEPEDEETMTPFLPQSPRHDVTETRIDARKRTKLEQKNSIESLKAHTKKFHERHQAHLPLRTPNFDSSKGGKKHVQEKKKAISAAKKPVIQKKKACVDRVEVVYNHPERKKRGGSCLQICRKRTTPNKKTYAPHPSRRIKNYHPPGHDMDTWVEIKVMNRNNKTRSMFYSLKHKIAYWDEPPSGATRIILDSDWGRSKVTCS